MNTYKYQALSKDGVKVNGVVEGFNEIDAVNRIKREYDIVLKVTEQSKKQGGFLSADIGGNKLNVKAFTVMCSQFAIILRSGIPVARAVDLIAAKTTDKKLKELLDKVAADVEGGRSLAASFEDNGKDFLPQTFIESIRAGEESGNVDHAFETMHEHFDKSSKISAKVRSALAYPMFVIVLGIGVVIVMMVKVIPTFTAIFDDLDAELPAITMSLIVLSNFFRKYWIVIVVTIVLAFLIYKAYAGTESGKYKLAQNRLKMPMLGEISQLSVASQFANTLVTMIDAGLPLTKSVSITSKAIDNYYVSQKVSMMTAQIEEGRTLGESMRAAECLPDILTDMAAVGEETGELSDTLSTIGAYYDDELDTAISRAMAKLEPALLVFIAGFAGYVVIALYIAMFSMYAAM